MNVARADASCTVFEAKIVVTGEQNFKTLNTVEAYDHIADN